MGGWAEGCECQEGWKRRNDILLGCIEVRWFIALLSSVSFASSLWGGNTCLFEIATSFQWCRLRQQHIYIPLLVSFPRFTKLWLTFFSIFFHVQSSLGFNGAYHYQMYRSFKSIISAKLNCLCYMLWYLRSIRIWMSLVMVVVGNLQGGIRGGITNTRIDGKMIGGRC